MKSSCAGALELEAGQEPGGDNVDSIEVAVYICPFVLDTGLGFWNTWFFPSSPFIVC